MPRSRREEETKEEIKKENSIKSFDSSLNPDDYKYYQSLEQEFVNQDESRFKKFTEEDYQRLQQNLILYKNGNREAGDYIVAAFHKTIHMYASFIVLKQITFIPYFNKKTQSEARKIHPSLVSFVKLFNIKNKEFNFKETCDYIHSLFKKYEFGDIYNELVLALLNMANKYRIITDPNDPKYKPNGTFHVYIKKCYHFEAFHFLTNISRDPLVSGFNIISTDDNSEFDDDFNDDLNNSFSKKVIVDEKAFDMYNLMIDYIDRRYQLENFQGITLKENNIDIQSDESLNFNWINGAVCSPIFKCLTEYERELLVLAYVKNQTEDTLAKLFHCSRQAIGIHKRGAIAKLKAYIEKGENDND